MAEFDQAALRFLLKHYGWKQLCKAILEIVPVGEETRPRAATKARPRTQGNVIPFPGVRHD
jgi:hypothetical protein